MSVASKGTLGRVPGLPGLPFDINRSQSFLGVWSC